VNDINFLESFIETIQLTEKRVVNDKGLIINIKKSESVLELYDLACKVINAVSSKKITYINFNHQPEHKVDDMPLYWFKAAEGVLKKNKKTLNKNTVKLLAVDAYRIFYLKKISDLSGRKIG